MSSEADRTGHSHAYELQCVRCEFATTVEGDVHDVLDVVDAHQKERTNDVHEHFVEFESDET